MFSYVHHMYPPRLKGGGRREKKNPARIQI